MKHDIRADKYNSIWNNNKLVNPDYYEDLFKKFKSLAVSMGDLDGIEELEKKIHDDIEKKLGAPIQLCLWTYKNLHSLNSFTKSKNPEYPREYVTKYEIRAWLDQIEDWLFQRLVKYEPYIRFREAQKIM